MNKIRHDVNQSPPRKEQDTLPPPDQQAVVIALRGEEQSALVFQLKRQRGKPLNGILIGIAIALVAVGTTVCVLNIVGTITGPWSSIFGVIMASAAVVTPLIRPLGTDDQERTRQLLCLISSGSRRGEAA